MKRSAAARRGVLLAGLFGAFGAAAAAVACSSFGSAALESDAAAPALDGSPEAGAAEGGGARVLATFSETFDDGTMLPGKWAEALGNGSAKMQITPGAGASSTNGLVVTVVNDSKYQNAYLRASVGKNAPAAYTAVFGFSARVAMTGTGFVLGPRFTTEDATGANGDKRSLVVDWHGGLTRLDKFVPSCDGGCIVPTTDAKVDQAWHRYVVTLAIHGPTPSDFGTVAYTFDGAPVSSADLTFSLSGPTAYGLDFGVTYFMGNGGGTITFDDVSLVVTE